MDDDIEINNSNENNKKIWLIGIILALAVIIVIVVVIVLIIIFTSTDDQDTEPPPNNIQQTPPAPVLNFTSPNQRITPNLIVEPPNLMEETTMTPDLNNMNGNNINGNNINGNNINGNNVNRTQFDFSENSNNMKTNSNSIKTNSSMKTNSNSVYKTETSNNDMTNINSETRITDWSCSYNLPDIDRNCNSFGKFKICNPGFSGGSNFGNNRTQLFCPPDYIDICAFFDGGLVFLVTPKLLKINSTLIHSNFFINAIEFFNGSIYANSLGRLLVYDLINEEWLVVTWSPDNILFITTTYNNDYLWIQTAVGGSLYDTMGNTVISDNQFLGFRFYGLNTTQFTDLIGNTIFPVNTPSSSILDNIGWVAYFSDGTIETIPVNSPFTRIKIIYDEIYYLH